jgi:hypothetical protein
MLTITGIEPTTTATAPGLFFPNRDTFLLETPDFLEPSDTGIVDRNIKSESIRPNSVFNCRFRDIVEKLESLSLNKTIKYNAMNAIWRLIREIDRDQLYQLKPIIHCDYSKYVCIKWRRGTRSLYLNIDDEEQWWSKNWEEDNKIKTDFDTVDYDNLLIHWEWLING